MQRRPFFALTAFAAAAALLTLPLAAKDPVPPVAPLSDYVWTSPGDGLFGGFSAIELSRDGATFAAISDSGAFVRGRITRDASGKITSASANGPTTRLLNERGDTLGSDYNDTEGLAMMADGTAFVSSEGPARVLRYANLGAKATALPVPGEFRAMQRNSALEALAVAADGTVYAIPERSGRVDRPFPVYRFGNGKWDQPFAVPRDGTLLPVGADIGPDGRLYVLEREFLGVAGFRMRLRSFAISDTALSDERRLVGTKTGRHGNLEGLSVWRNADGHLIATMISDDNYKWFLATEIVEYDLGPDGAGLPAG
jgi:hypothetical protein